MKIGIAGTGRMGAAIAQRLMNLCHEITVWNRTAEKTRPLAAAGAKVAATPSQLAASSETIVTILTDATAIDAAYRGKDGLLAGDVAGKLFVEMSTVRPETERALAGKIRAKGAAMIECPVGAGASMKLAINLPLLVFWQAFGEALALVRPLGLDATRLVDIFSDTSGGPAVLKNRGPALAAALQGKEVGPITVDIDAMRKDLRTMVEEASALGTELPVTSRALECYDQASGAGLGKGDITAIPVRWMKR